jgi:(2Fe-2S) ferredoxin
MIQLQIHPKVSDDLCKSTAWYREIDPNLAASFLEEAYKTMELIQVAPE